LNAGTRFFFRKHEFIRALSRKDFPHFSKTINNFNFVPIKVKTLYATLDKEHLVCHFCEGRTLHENQQKGVMSPGIPRLLVMYLLLSAEADPMPQKNVIYSSVLVGKKQVWKYAQERESPALIRKYLQ